MLKIHSVSKVCLVGDFKYACTSNLVNISIDIRLFSQYLYKCMMCLRWPLAFLCFYSYHWKTREVPVVCLRFGILAKGRVVYVEVDDLGGDQIGRGPQDMLGLRIYSE